MGGVAYAPRVTRPVVPHARRVATLVVATLLAASLLVVAMLLHVPYVELVPGPVTDTLGTVDGKPLIQVSGHPTYPTDGHLYLTTVGVPYDPSNPLPLGTAMRGWLDAHVAVVPESEIFPPGQSQQQVQQQNTQEMTQSQDHAIVAALSSLGIPVTTQVTVASVAAGSPAVGHLRPGDVIVAVDGTPIDSEGTLRSAITKHAPGDTVHFTVVRDGATVQVDVTATSQQGRTIVGILPGTKHTYPFTVSIGLQDVGGPSAGLMFALGIIDRLTPGSLTGGMSIAGTGTIDDTGAVGPIGGVAQKVVGAREAGATVFLTPAGDCAEAKANRPDGLRLVKVTSLQGALSALSALRGGAGTVPSC